MIDKEKRIRYAAMDAHQFNIYLKNLSAHWLVVKMMEIDEPDNRDATFVKELANLIELIGIPIQVLSQQKKLHPSYVLKKLNAADRHLKTTIQYFKSKSEGDKVNE
jgi:hypothetical protein